MFSSFCLPLLFEVSTLRMLSVCFTLMTVRYMYCENVSFGSKVILRVCGCFVVGSVSSSSSFEGYTLQFRHKQDWGRGFTFYYPRLLHCLNQMLAVMLLSQHLILSSKAVRPRAPYGTRCIGHAVSSWSTVCSEAPHSQFGEGARPYLCMDEWKRPTPVHRRLSLTQAAWGKPIPISLALVPGTKHGAWKHFHNTLFSICDLSIQKRGCQVWQGCPKDSAHLAQTGLVWILVSLGQYLRTHLKDHTRYDRGPEIHDDPRRVSLPVGEAQLAGCLRVQVGGPLEWDAGIQ